MLDKSNAMRTAIPTPSDHWIVTPRGRLFARRWQPSASADGHAPIVLLHDSLGSIQLWRSFPAALAAGTGRSVIAYDRLGFGQSDPRTGDIGTGFIDEEAAAFFPLVLRHFGLEHFIAMGHSVGGGMAVHCAARHADACQALITESAQAFVEERTRTGILEAKASFQQEQSFARLRQYHGDKARWVLDAWTETWLSPTFAAWSLNNVLPLVRCPTLVLHGGDDEYGSSQQPERIAGLAGGPAQLTIMPGVRHVPHREREGAVVDRIATFLASAVPPLRTPT
ncbi:alpha/beta hydrolase [Duganella sp. LX20W]|uniref:Alpha/beta hydrolase n=1 Tax=Rugamonas brunnea TaxID=2758569 RepID=A0A7W2EQA2_9BURK|nr:alpha/beta hydrolase [Rugamonas brunnea]MBA5636676.1 alpha/beta hydrolase [Rugamonas brunnea]